MGTTFTDATLTVDDLQGDIAGSIFTNCTFEETAGGDIIEAISFVVCQFNNCTWDTVVESCNFKGCDGDSIAPKTKIVFDSPPADGVVVRDAHGFILAGDGATTEFYVKRLVQSVLDAAITKAIPSINYAITMGKMGMTCGSGNSQLTREGLLAQCLLEISTDATDTASPVDGVPDITADGTSYCTITLKKKDRSGAYKTAAEDNDTITLECTRGKLSDLQVDLVNGEAAVMLTSVPETCISTVIANGGDLGEVRIDIQFAP